MNIQFELVEIVTKDKLVHQGIFYAPPSHKASAGQAEKAILWVHGLTDSFYGDPLLMNAFVEACKMRDIAFASFNNRGHDFLTSAHQLDENSKKGYVHKTIGSGVENFSDCAHDLDAAISFLASAGYEHVVLVGHSTGANKVCFYTATQHNPRVIGVALAGPISDRYSAADEETHKEHKRIIKQKILDGKGDELLFGFDYFPLTPKRWVSLLEEGSAEDVFNYQDPTGALATYEKIRLPLRVIFGENDEYADRSISEIRKAFDAHARSDNYESIVISGTNHGFNGKEKEFVSAVVNWAASL